MVKWNWKLSLAINVSALLIVFFSWFVFVSIVVRNAASLIFGLFVLCFLFDTMIDGVGKAGARVFWVEWLERKFSKKGGR